MPINRIKRARKTTIFNIKYQQHTCFYYIHRTNEIMFLPPSVCLSVCLFVSPLDYSKSYEWILMNFLERWRVTQRTIDRIFLAIRTVTRIQIF